jgi:multidrug efflux system membrane fusion protein
VSVSLRLPFRCTVVLWACAMVGVVACGAEPPPPELPPRAIKWERISGELAHEQRVISGIVTAIDDTVLAFQVGGTVETVEVDLGQAVEVGQVLVRLDKEPFELVVRDAEAELANAVALRESARADHERQIVLFREQVASRQELERATARRDSRDSQVAAATARLNLARRDLRRSVLLAPFSGSISVRQVEPAMEVAGGQVVLEMDSEESGLRVEVQMPETLIARVRQGDEVRVGFPSIGDARSQDEPLRVTAIVSDVGTRAGVGNAFPVRANLTDPPAGLRPGMTAEVFFSLLRGDIATSQAQGVMIPMAAALAEADDRFSVFVFDRETSSVKKRPIRTGGVSDNDIAVLEGIEDGEIIATAGVSFLRDGQKVTLLDERLLRANQ